MGFWRQELAAGETFIVEKKWRAGCLDEGEINAWDGDPLLSSCDGKTLRLFSFLFFDFLREKQKRTCKNNLIHLQHLYHSQKEKINIEKDGSKNLGNRVGKWLGTLIDKGGIISYKGLKRSGNSEKYIKVWSRWLGRNLEKLKKLFTNRTGTWKRIWKEKRMRGGRKEINKSILE